MNTPRMLNILLVCSLLPLSVAVKADDLCLFANAPPAYQAECGSCHIAFPPQLLGAGDWRQVMATLDRHYGDNASLDEAVRRTIADFLVGHAGPPSKVGAGGGAARPGALPRLTATPWFTRKHREVPRADWSHPKVKTPSNCGACHTRAAQGSYREREIVLPDGRRWED
ncbi:MAG TPA: cytochrome C [Thiobacillaceae bacterium]|nr:cytochrome C [Thiobacillaceae bacterium]HNU64191.1 cytochrome C [Thiobacillaceae bacterium]